MKPIDSYSHAHLQFAAAVWRFRMYNHLVTCIHRRKRNVRFILWPELWSVILTFELGLDMASWNTGPIAVPGPLKCSVVRQCHVIWPPFTYEGYVSDLDNFTDASRQRRQSSRLQSRCGMRIDRIIRIFNSAAARVCNDLPPDVIAAIAASFRAAAGCSFGRRVWFMVALCNRETMYIYGRPM